MFATALVDAPTTPTAPFACRTAAVTAAYAEHRRTYTGPCAFCEVPGDVLLEEAGTMQVVVNTFPYAVWDARRVEDHLMVVPRRHLLSFGEYTDLEGVDFFATVRRYEAMGYSIYTRAATNTSRSVGHAHTHLIKTGDVAA